MDKTVKIYDTYLEDDYSELTFILDEYTKVEIRGKRIGELYRLAHVDPDRRFKGGVEFPATWLTGGRIGY